VRSDANRGGDAAHVHLCRIERLHFEVLRVTLTQVPAETQCGIRWQFLVLNALRKDDAERSSNSANRVDTQPFCAERGHELAAVSSSDRGHRAFCKRRKDVAFQIVGVKGSSTPSDSRGDRRGTVKPPRG
jgi:hypothetical protein